MIKYIICVEKQPKSYLWGFSASLEQMEAITKILTDLRHLDIIDSYTVKEANLDGNNGSTTKGTN